MTLDSRIKYEPWAQWRTHVRLRQGEHCAIVGSTGSGKTVLARELLKDRSYVVVLGTKNNDPELYPKFQEVGYKIVNPRDFDSMPDEDESRVIFRPRLETPDADGRRRQADAFRTMLFELWETGGWTTYVDEALQVVQSRGLGPTLEEFWIAGRSENLTVVASTQEPVNVPRLMFTASTHLFFFRNNDKPRIDRMAEMSAGHAPLVREILPTLPEHEFIYINTRTRQILRSKVILGA